MLATAHLTSNPYALTANVSDDELRGNASNPFPATTEISVARLTDDRQMELRLRYGAAITEAYIYYNAGEDWLNMMESSLIPQIAQQNVGFAVADPPSDAAHADVIKVARLIFKQLRSGTVNASLDAQLIQLLFRLPRVFALDELALTTAVLSNPDLRNKIPQLKNPKIYGKYVDLVNRSGSTVFIPSKANFRSLPRGAIAAIQEILMKDYTITDFGTND